jgi:hypothetical protein
MIRVKERWLSVRLLSRWIYLSSNNRTDAFCFRTERTYVKGLQELVDIYVKAASVPVNSLTSATSKETVVPVVERKIVFGSIDPLFSFHKESFLPALEAAAAPILTSAAALQDADADGQLSLSVAKAVGGTFARHAAFMKMYSTYIKYVSWLRVDTCPFTNMYLAILRTLCNASRPGLQTIVRRLLQVLHRLQTRRSWLVSGWPFRVSQASVKQRDTHF